MEGASSAATGAATLTSVRENVSEAVRILLLRRWLFLVPFCIATVTATTISHYSKRTYTAYTTFERVDDDVLQNLPVRTTVGSFIPFRETLVRDMKAPELVDAAVARIGLADDLPRNPDGTLSPEGQATRRRIGARLAGRVSVGILKSTSHKDIVRLAYSGPKCPVAGQFLDAMRDEYIQRTQKRITERLLVNKAYFEQEAFTRRGIVDALDQKKVEREVESPTIDPTRPDMIFLRLTSLRNEHRELERRHETTTAKLLKTRQYITSIENTATVPREDGEPLGPVVVPRSPRIREIESQIARIDADIEDLKVRRQMTDRHPEIIAQRELRGRYAQLLVGHEHPLEAVTNQSLAIRPERAMTSTPTDVWRAAKLRAETDAVTYEDDLERLAASKQRVLGEVATLEEVQGNVPAARRAQRQMDEELGIARKDYAFYAQKTQHFALLLSADEDERGIKFKCLGPAVASSKPSAPKAKSILVLSLLIGIGAGVAFVLIAELLDRSYHTSKQVVHSLGLNIIESIDEIITSADRARRFRRRFILAPAVAVLLLGAVGLSTSLVYLSLERPATYERLIQRPRDVWTRISDRLAQSGPIPSGITAAVSASGSLTETPD
ncbi:MAG: hypothetical protein GY842_27360 [bacterium]|nr:hypothetical protein [bacterium]